jgi:hypothetical protein
MLRMEAALMLTPAELRSRLNALARPRRGVLHSPRNELLHDKADESKPYWGHWAANRFSLSPQRVSRWHSGDQWRAHFDGELEPAPPGCIVRIRASLGLWPTITGSMTIALLLSTATIGLLQQTNLWLPALVLAGLLLWLGWAWVRRQSRQLLRRLAQ